MLYKSFRYSSVAYNLLRIAKSKKLLRSHANSQCFSHSTIIGTINSKGLKKLTRYISNRDITGRNNSTPMTVETEVQKNDEDLPKLERQLTSNFDRGEVDDDFDMDAFEKDIENGVKQVEEKNVPVSIVSPQSQAAPTLYFKTGEATDIGGGHVNQDKSLCFRAGRDNEHLVLAVFDGHGRDLGELAAIVAKDYMTAELRKHSFIEDLKVNPQPTLNKLFEGAHLKIKDIFREQVQRHGDFEVVETDQGYLVKREKGLDMKSNHIPYMMESNVHGGTTATLAIVLDGRRLIVANVGDSTALFGGLDQQGRVLYKELSAEHSPECIEEFTRVKSCNHVKNIQHGAQDKTLVEQMSLRFVYDVIDRSAAATPKHSCPPIFAMDHSTGVAKKVNEAGYYYKNVRSEWATLVTTPPTAKFQDALAFTRSLGDLHLQVYGVSHIPEIREYDIQSLHKQVSDEASTTDASLLFVCTDGVWDNWKYEDIIRKVISSSLLSDAVKSDSAQPLTDELMAENLRLARNYFGHHADNMTGILCVVHNGETSS